MPYPSITAYLEAIQLPDSFKDLVGIEPVLNSNNEPIIIAGGNAVVFKMRYQGKQVAIKCFTNESEERTLRYAAISDYLQLNPSPYFVTFKYYETELFIDGEEYPVVLMDWVEGKTLGTSMLEAYKANDSNFLSLQASKLLDMFLFLLHQPIAHGDLKHENILVKNNGELVLVDYDGMYIPTLAGKQSIELGSKGYQHPERDASWFNQDLDNFSMMVLMLTHLYLAELPENYTPDSSGQLFTEADFKSLGNSQINACFQFKICRQWAAYLFDVCEEKSLLNGTNDFLRSAHSQMNDLIFRVKEVHESNAKINKQIGLEYFNTGLKYQNGHGVELDYTKAMDYYQKAVLLENSDAMHLIGKLYYYGRGVKKDFSKAIEWFLKSADLENSEAMLTLGFVYGNILAKELKDYKQSLNWYLKSAELNNVRAMRSVADLYYYGRVVPLDYSLAMEWYKKASNLGDSISMNQVGNFYKYGKGVEQNYNLSMEWYKKAADLGNKQAMESISYFYNNGLGVPEDRKLAYEWYKKTKESKSK